MDFQYDGSLPMSDEMVDDLLNNFLKNVDDDDTSSPVDQRTDEEGGMVTGDGQTSGSDTKQSDGFHSPKPVALRKTASDPFPHSKPHTGNSSSFEDDEATVSTTSNNANGDLPDRLNTWFPSAAALPGFAHGEHSVPGMMLTAGFERGNGLKSQRTSSEDSDNTEKAPNRYGGLRSPRNTGGRSTHAAPRAGLDVQRNAGAITQQWPPQTSSAAAGTVSTNGYPGRRSETPPPAYTPTTNAIWASALGVLGGAHHHTGAPPTSLTGTPPESAMFRTQPAPSLLFQRRSAAQTAQSRNTTAAPNVASPPSFMDSQFFVAPGSYDGRDRIGTPPTTAPQPPYVMVPPRGGQPGVSQAPVPLFNPDQPVMLTMAQLSALLQPPPQSASTMNTAPVQPQSMPFPMGLPQAGVFQPKQPSTGAGSVSMPLPSAQNGGFTATPVHSQHPGSAVHYSLPAPQTHTFAGPTSQTTMRGGLPASGGHVTYYGAVPPQYARHAAVDLNSSALSARRLHEDKTDRRTGSAPLHLPSFPPQHTQATNGENLPRPPWQLPRSTTTHDHNGNGGHGLGDPISVHTPGTSSVYAWVRRNGRWQSFVLGLN